MDEQKRKPPAAGMGRIKGSQNNITKAIKQMVEESLNEVGGTEYFVKQAIDNPVAYMALLGKILPRQIDGDVNASIVVTWKK